MELASQPPFWGLAARLTLVRRLQEQSREEISRKKTIKNRGAYCNQRSVSLPRRRNERWW